MPPFLKGLASFAASVVVLLISQYLILRNQVMLDLAHRTGIDPGVAIGSVIILIGGYFLLEDLMKSSSVAKAGSLKSLWLTIQNLKFRSFRSAAILVGSAVVVGSLFIGLFLVAGAMNSIELAEERVGADLIVVPSDTLVKTQPFYTYPFSFNSFMDRSYIQRIAAIEGVKRVSGQYFMGDVTFNEGCGVLEKAFFVAIDDDDFVVSSLLGRGYAGGLGVGEVIRGSSIPERMYFYSALQIFNFTVKESIPETGTYIDHLIYFSRETAAKITEFVKRNDSGISYLGSRTTGGDIGLQYNDDKVNIIYVKAETGVDLDVMAQRIWNALGDVTIIKMGVLRESTKNRLGALMSVFSMMNGATLAVSLVLISSMSLMAVNEQRRELGLLRAIGASKAFMAKLVTMQTTILTFFGGVVGMMAAWLALYMGYYDIMRLLKIPFLCPAILDTLSIVLTAIAFSVAVGVVASIFPSLKISRTEPLSIIKSGP